MKKLSQAALFIVLLFAGSACTTGEGSQLDTQVATEANAPVQTAVDESVDSTLYVVAAYDPERDPAEDLKLAVERARVTNKRILLEVGGDWCSWCHALDRFIHENTRVADKLREEYLIVKVNYSEENENAAFLSQYPEIPGYPHIFVLESDGTFLHSQGTGELELDKSYSEEAFLAFLDTWASSES